MCGHSQTATPFCLALAVRDMHITAEQALHAATVRFAAACDDPIWVRITPGGGADAVVLDAPSYAHLVYRPGVPLVHAVVERGVVSRAEPQTEANAAEPHDESDHFARNECSPSSDEVSTLALGGPCPSGAMQYPAARSALAVRPSP